MALMGQAPHAWEFCRNRELPGSCRRHARTSRRRLTRGANQQLLACETIQSVGCESKRGQGCLPCSIQHAHEQYVNQEVEMEAGFQQQLKSVETSMTDKWDRMAEKHSAFIQVGMPLA